MYIDPVKNKSRVADPSVFKDFKNIKFFQMELGVRIYDDLLADGPLNRCDEVVFLPVKQFCNFGVDLDRKPGAHHSLGLSKNLSINIITNGVF